MHAIRFFFIIIVLITLCPGQTAFTITSLQGQAKVQRADKKVWEEIGIGGVVNDNDMVETFFQTKLICQFGNSNLAILGSNSKALFNISDAQFGGEDIAEASLTLFSGGAFCKIIDKAHISLYTSNAVAETRGGAMSTVVEAKSGNTGFQILGGTVNVRNIAQKQWKPLTAGLTTMIYPGREPTAPLYMTYRHVTVLKHFFGDEYVSNELQSAGIKPTDESRQSKLSLTGALLSSRRGRGASDAGMYKFLFSLNKIYGNMMEVDKKKRRQYTAILPPPRNKGLLRVDTDFGMAIAAGATYPHLNLRAGVHRGKLDFGIRLGLAADSSQSMGVYNFGSLAGILDLVDHIHFGKPQDSVFISLGPIDSYTLGQGIAVRDFRNDNAYALFQPLGLQIQAGADLFSTRAFVSDIATFNVFGLYGAWRPSIYSVAAGYYMDINQLAQSDGTVHGRFTGLPPADSTTTFPGDTSGMPSALPLIVYEIDLSADVAPNEEFCITVLGAFAQKLSGGVNDGYVLRIPAFNLEWQGMNMGAGMISEKGRLPYGNFSSYYMTHRLQPRRVRGNGNADTIYTLNSLLSKEKRTFSLDFYLRMNPIPDLDVDIRYKQTLADHDPVILESIDSSVSTQNFAYSFRVAAGPSLVPVLDYAAVTMRQLNGGLHPPLSSFFGSWGSHLNLEAMTAPLLFKIIVYAELDLLFLDLDGEFNNIIDGSDAVTAFRLGVKRAIF